MTAVVIGVGNPHRRDDGVGPAVADVIARQGLLGVRVVSCAAEPTAVLDAWEGADMAVVVDAARGDEPGRVRLCTVDDLAETAPLSSHDLNLAQTYSLGRVLGRAPRRVVVVTIDAADLDHGSGLSPAVAAGVQDAAAAVLAELARFRLTPSRSERAAPLSLQGE